MHRYAYMISSRIKGINIKAYFNTLDFSCQWVYNSFIGNLMEEVALFPLFKGKLGLL